MEGRDPLLFCINMYRIEVSADTSALSLGVCVKTCNKCQISKPLSEFSKNKLRKDGHNSNCKLCHKDYVAKHYQENKSKYLEKADNWKNKNPEKRRKISTGWMRRVSGNYVTEAQFNEMLTAQNSCCLICEKKFLTTRDTHVDHDHITGKIRGLLCSSCNKGLGFFKDSVKSLELAIQYIKKFGEQL